MARPQNHIPSWQSAQQQSLDLTRAKTRVATKAGRIDARPRNRVTDPSGTRIGYTLPGGTTYTPGAGTSISPTSPDVARASRVTASMRDGSFWKKQSTFNQANAGKQIMDDHGNIAPVGGPNAYRDGGQLPGSTTTGAVANPTPTAPAADGAPQKPDTPVAYLGPQLPKGPLPSKGRIFNNGRDVTADIQKGLAGDRSGSFYTGSQYKEPAPSPVAPAPAPLVAKTAAPSAPAPASPAVAVQPSAAVPTAPKAPLTPVTADPTARTAATMQQAGKPGTAPAPQAPITADPATTPARVDTQPVAPRDTRQLRSIAGDRGAWYGTAWPQISFQTGTSKARPVLEKYGLPGPPDQVNGVTRVQSDHKAVAALAKSGVLQGSTYKDAGGQEHMKLKVVTPQPVIPKNDPGSMGQRQMTMPTTVEDPLKKKPGTLAGL